MSDGTDRQQFQQQLAGEAKKTVAQGGAGVSTSDEILEPGSRGMYYFQYFIPPYRDWTGSAPDLGKDIRDVYDNLRGINFAHFRADATQLSTSHGTLSDSALNVASATSSLGGFWQGAAAQAAQQFCGSFVRDARTATDGVDAASQVITTAMKAIETAVLQRAQGVLPLYATDVGGVAPDGVRQLIDIARNKASEDELRSVSTWPVFQNVDWGDTDCHGNLSQNVRNLAGTDATSWLNTTFVTNFEQKKQSFDSITRSTHDAVGKLFDTMNQGLGKINANPFTDLSNGIQVDARAADSGGGAAGGSGGEVGGSGGGAVSGGSGGTVSSAAPPAATPVQAPTPAAALTTQDANVRPGDGSGRPTTDPAGDPTPATPAVPAPPPAPIPVAPTHAAAPVPAATTQAQPVAVTDQSTSYAPPDPATHAPTPDIQATTLAAAMPLGGGVAAGGGLDPTGGAGAVTGGVLDGGQAVASHVVAAHHPVHDVLGGVVNPPGHPGVAGTNVTPIGQPGDAGLASAPDSALNGGDPSGSGGMPMMGGMGMGGGQGGDQQRGVHHQWRTFGHLFDDATGDDTIGGFSGTLDDSGGR
jgi:uncharacterized protein YukE